MLSQNASNVSFFPLFKALVHEKRFFNFLNISVFVFVVLNEKTKTKFTSSLEVVCCSRIWSCCYWSMWAVVVVVVVVLDVDRWSVVVVVEDRSIRGHFRSAFLRRNLRKKSWWCCCCKDVVLTLDINRRFFTYIRHIRRIGEPLKECLFCCSWF